jgi:hypothetical protein
VGSGAITTSSASPRLAARLGFALFAWAITAAAECLPYEPDEVTLVGIVKYRTFAGPPNYRSLASGDRPERAAILELESPICVRHRKEGESAANIARDDIRLVELVLLPSISRPSPDSRIAVTGTLSGAHAVHHRTPVLLYVRAINGDTRSKSE